MPVHTSSAQNPTPITSQKNPSLPNFKILPNEPNPTTGHSHPPLPVLPNDANPTIGHTQIRRAKPRAIPNHAHPKDTCNALPPDCYSIAETTMSSAHAATRAALEQLIGDKYEVLHWIGGGGMAEVFLARHRTHGAKFAVKVLADHLAGDPRIVARFIEEARTAAVLSGHPNIAVIFDVGGAGTVHYLIMPYVEGEDLSHYLLRHGPLPLAEVIFIASQTTDALGWASERNIVHRDLKPSNIRIDRTGRIVVLDFGIAKAADSPTGLTTAGETPGTPYYMSPEQIRGELCDTRSDLYSLGIVLFELLTAKKPFDGETVRAIEYGHLEKLPPTLSSVLDQADPRIEQIVSRLLEKDPAKRFQTPGELGEALQAICDTMPPVRLKPELDSLQPNHSDAGYGGRLGRETTSPEPPTITTLPAPPPVPKPRKLGPAIAAILALVAAASAGAWWFTRPTPATNVIADPGTDVAATLARSLQDAQGTMFLVPAGPFIFGDDAPESPNRKQSVTLPAFYIDATEVSNEQYSRFVQATGHAPPGSAKTTAANFPVAGVTNQDAADYCTWAGRRLPTEQEWEKAARGPDGAVYPWGAQPMSNPGKLVAVDEYPERQSPSGALNMSGNVFEWTASSYTPSSEEIADLQKTSGVAFSPTWRSLKGGSFLVKNELFFRCYMRRGWPVDLALPSIGFRCVKDAK